MARDIIVLGAGVVGVSVACHLVERGHDVTLIDRREPGRETSFGNAGIIQREAVEPYAFPHDLRTLLRVVFNRSVDIRYRPAGVLSAAGSLLRYWLNSAPARYARIVPEYASLIMESTRTHETMIEAAGAQHLVGKEGWLELYRRPGRLAQRAAHAVTLRERYGVESGRLDRDALRELEPHLSDRMIGAIHWQNAWTIASPGDLVEAYAGLFTARGGHLLQDEITDLSLSGATWRVKTGQHTHQGSDVVIALGPWSSDWVRKFGYHLPLFVKRGYHMHYGVDAERPLHHWFMDAEIGYLVEPMTQGLRLTTGAELERRDSRPHLSQLDAAEEVAREVFPSMGERLDARPWTGARPCTSDMKPIIGPAPRHPGLWFAFGHGHQGFTLGPATGAMLGRMIDGEPPHVDPQPFRAERFGSAGAVTGNRSGH